jgi:hypothetical protein
MLFFDYVAGHTIIAALLQAAMMQPTHRSNSSSRDRCNRFKRTCVKCSRGKTRRNIGNASGERQIFISVARNGAAGVYKRRKSIYAAIFCRERKPRASKIGST